MSDLVGTRQLPDARTGSLKSVAVTLGGAGAITTVHVPDSAIGFRLYPATAVRYASDENPSAAASSSDASVATSALGTGGIAKADAWTQRVLSPGVSRQLRLRGAAGAEVIEVEFF